MRRQTIILLVLMALLGRAWAAENLIRNGSFEGGLLYWHNIQPAVHALVSDPVRDGAQALHIEREVVMSAPFAVERGKPITASFWVKGDRAGQVLVQIPPSAREVGSSHGRLWTNEATRTVAIGTAWQRVVVSMPADVPQDGFWPQPHYLLQIAGSVPITIDGVVVNQEAQGAADYVPRRPIEVLATCAELKGYEADGNLLEAGATVHITAHASNPGTAAAAVMLRWQLIDYEGEEPLGPPVERAVTIASGQTVHEVAALTLSVPGTVLVRTSVLMGGRVIDSSDQPLTSLPYPFPPRTPDMRERFGASFMGPHTAQLASRMGLAWSRWFPHSEWQDHQPTDGSHFTWFDSSFDLLQGLGISAHVVLYGWPRWIMDQPGGNPLPRDMRWKADDPRWQDLSVVTAWDSYIAAVTKHYQGRPLVYEIENEPEFDHWDQLTDEYAQFTIRTARQIKRGDPKAQVMVNNVYGIPSALNRRMLELGGATVVDIISWHDYHAGWLADAQALKRMKAALAGLGAEHIAIWFNEGWCYTNTAVDEPIACTGLTSAQSTNAVIDSIAELTAAGQEKTVLFHNGYEQHGMSFWDYAGPGTMLWDWYGNPLPLVPAWNVLAYHIGLSQVIGMVRPPGTTCCIFQDQRHGRGVMVAYADREAAADATIDLPLAGLTVEDAMGRAHPLAGSTLTLARSGRPVFLYDAKRTSGAALIAAMEQLDRSHVSFVAIGGTIHLPATWAGTANGSAAGNPVLHDGHAVWRLDQVSPADPSVTANYHPLIWQDGWWVAVSGGYGGQPKAEMRDRGIRMEFRASHSASPGEKLCGLVYHAAQAGAVRLSGSAEIRLWDGGNPTRLSLWRKTPTGATELASTALKAGERVDLGAWQATLAAGDELVLLPRIEGMFTGGDVTLRDLAIAPAGAAAKIWTLPATWEGATAGATDGNPVTVQGTPVWRLDQLWPADQIIMAAQYRPLVWSGSEWIARDHGHGGQPALRVADGSLIAAVSGPWRGVDGEQQHTAALVFVAPHAGMYQVRATVRAAPWAGDAASYPLVLLKKDAQRAAELLRIAVPRGSTPVPLAAEVELTAGHELLFLPLVPTFNNATTMRIDQLAISERP